MHLWCKDDASTGFLIAATGSRFLHTVTYEIAVRYEIADPLKSFVMTITRGYRIAKSAKQNEVVVKSER
jgi:hypothetical protein